jgi:hypothetical protein
MNIESHIIEKYRRHEYLYFSVAWENTISCGIRHTVCWVVCGVGGLRVRFLILQSHTYHILTSSIEPVLANHNYDCGEAAEGTEHRDIEVLKRDHPRHPVHPPPHRL